MSLWPFPRKVVTVIFKISESGAVLWGFTKAGVIYAVERAAQRAVVGSRLRDVEDWENEEDKDKGVFVVFDFIHIGRKGIGLDTDLAMYILLNTGIRMVGHAAIAGTIVASVYPHLPLTFIVGSTALVVAAADLGGWPSYSNTKNPSPIELTSSVVGGVACCLRTR